jgi:type VI secretion system protein ImpG
MADELLTYYERELSFLRQVGAEFAVKYPKIASRLLLEADKCEDPHVERLIQAFAFLAARIRYKLDDDFPEITDSLLSVLYPHYLAPVPSMAVVQFVLDAERGKLTEAFRIPRGARLHSPPVSGAPCRFRTAYPVVLWPLKVESARLAAADGLGATARAVSVLRLGLRTQGGTTIAALRPDVLRFFLLGEGHQTYALYELLCNNVREIQLRPGAKGKASDPIRLGPDHVRPVGFGADEGLLPYGPRSFLGYRLLHEYFALPEKFLFVDVVGLDAAARAGFTDELEILIFLDHMPKLGDAIAPGTFRLGCTPIVNLFEQIVEPIRLSHAESEYRVVVDGRRQDATEVYAIDSVVSTSPDDPEPVVYRPFYSFKHGVDQEQQRAFWYATRRPSSRKGDAGTEVYLSLVDLDFKPTRPAVDTLTVHATCSNRDLPARLPFGGERGVLDLEGAAPLSQILCLTKPTATTRPRIGRGAQWRLISHLSLNYLSVCEGGREALQEILRLYDFSESPAVRQQIAGILDVRSRRVVGRPGSMPWNGFCRGLEVTVELDEEQYVGAGVYLFASVLEKFLGLYTSLNSFTQLVARTRQRKEALKRWPPRAGEQILL